MGGRGRAVKGGGRELGVEIHWPFYCKHFPCHRISQLDRALNSTNPAKPFSKTGALPNTLTGTRFISSIAAQQVLSTPLAGFSLWLQPASQPARTFSRL